MDRKRDGGGGRKRIFKKLLSSIWSSFLSAGVSCSPNLLLFLLHPGGVSRVLLSPSKHIHLLTMLFLE